LALTPSVQSPGRPGIAGILLAAGAGSRFGGGKLIHPLSDGTPIGVRAWRTLSAALPEVTVVVRTGDDRVEAMFREVGAAVVLCPDAHLGMGHSLACAVRATASATGWVIALADMPALRPSTIRTIGQRLEQGSGIVVPVHQGERGHPVGFSVDYRERLMNLGGDSGARAILMASAASVERIEVDDPGVLQDVDTREDVGRLERCGRGAA
jgi:molybdenum cofactor cytidylyltransferase